MNIYPQQLGIRTHNIDKCVRLDNLGQGSKGNEAAKVIAMDENACIHNGLLAPSECWQLKITFAISFLSGRKHREIIRVLGFANL